MSTLKDVLGSVETDQFGRDVIFIDNGETIECKVMFGEIHAFSLTFNADTELDDAMNRINAILFEPEPLAFSPRTKEKQWHSPMIVEGSGKRFLRWLSAVVNVMILRLTMLMLLLKPTKNDSGQSKNPKEPL